jgi:hypothetical protein
MRDVVFAATVFLSAWLLFQVQPLAGKRILPWFGGGPAVWTTALLFFQAALLAGYLYAHLSATLLRPRGQALLHSVLLATAVGILATSGIIAGEQWKPVGSERPQLRIALILVVYVGLPYTLLSATAPLVQSWWSRTHEAGSPYRLYALSNVGSLAGLLSYPLVVEPLLRLGQQGAVWSTLFSVFAALCIVSAWNGSLGNILASKRADEALGTTTAMADSAPRAVDWFHWIALPACGSALLLAVTNYLCQDVASLPLLWVAPLAIYLLTFILAFDADRWYVRWAWMASMAICSFAAATSWLQGPSFPLVWQVLINLALLLTGAMVCHGEAARMRPPARRLTAFYLCLSLGGVLGGLFVAVLAPHVFRDFYELPLIVFALWAFAMTTLAADRRSPLYRGKRPFAWASLAIMWAGLSVVMASPFVNPSEPILASARNFFGVLKIRERDTDGGLVRTLLNGRISHGSQFEAVERRRHPTTYYSPGSGVGQLLSAPAGVPRTVGVVGLGTGTLAAYAESGDEFAFYDINPLAVEIAEREFTYLEDARRRGAQVDVVLGDARLSLDQEKRTFDVLALDAFSGDAIPVHLLTREAFAVYLKRMRQPGGVVAVHISNRYLNLRPIVLAAAEEFGLEARVAVNQDKSADGELSSTWVLLYGIPARSAAVTERVGELLRADDTLRPIVWTDDYSSILNVLKRQSVATEEPPSIVPD